ncbi:MAG: hypothetical protein HY308_06920 [Gammaproteobacteria bacterium]|nr:hypothetical protein [Gammaproteobacteria bacterium]
MDPKAFVCRDAGAVVRTPEGYHAFVPAPPPTLIYDAVLVAVQIRA